MRIFYFLAGFGIFFSVIGRFVDYALVTPGFLGDGFAILNYFSYFTIQTNILIGIWFIGAGLKPNSQWESSPWRGALAVYGLVTGVIFWTLLTGSLKGTTSLGFWTNSLLHLIAPVCMLVQFLLKSPGKTIPWSTPVYWVIFPLAYAVYTFLRGLLTGWFPYFFIDPSSTGSWSSVVITAAIFVLAFFILGFIMRQVGRWVPPILRSQYQTP